jgi:hypothetical protein
VHVKGVNRTHSAIDTGPLIPLHTKEHFPQQFKCLLDNKEEIDCVIPLLSAEELDLAPLLNTRLFNLMITFSVTENPDAVFESSYVSLLFGYK